MAFKVKRAKVKENNSFEVKPVESEYDKQANNFLKETNTKFKIKYLKHDKYFPEDKETRDIYKFTLEKDGKKYSGTFGQSVQGSWNNEVPSAYAVLSSVGADMGDENESWEDFADTFGYDRDSHSGRKIHQAVLKERKGVKALYSEDEINKMQEIQ